ncbi:MAG: TRL domain-containing protein [Planctomycetota bacterium]
MRGKLLVALGTLLGVGCNALPKVPVRPPGGALFTSVEAPLTTDFDGEAVSSKQGSASAVYVREPFFGLSISWGDASIKAAAQNGYLKNVGYADYDMIQVLGIFGLFTVRVHGE